MPNPPRSCDRLDDDHMTAVVHRRWGGARTPGHEPRPGVRAPPIYDATERNKQTMKGNTNITNKFISSRYI